MRADPEVDRQELGTLLAVDLFGAFYYKVEAYLCCEQFAPLSGLCIQQLHLAVDEFRWLIVVYS